MFYFKQFNGGKEIALIDSLAICQHKAERAASLTKPEILNSKKRHQTKTL